MFASLRDPTTVIDWKKYYSKVVESLPHEWRHRTDTNFMLQRLQSSRSNQNSESKWTSEGLFPNINNNNNNKKIIYKINY